MLLLGGAAMLPDAADGNIFTLFTVILSGLLFKPSFGICVQFLHNSSICYESISKPYLLQHFSGLEYHALGLFPAQAGISDALAVNASVQRLIAVFDIALNHEALYEFFDVRIVSA